MILREFKLTQKSTSLKVLKKTFNEQISCNVQSNDQSDVIDNLRDT